MKYLQIAKDLSIIGACIAVIICCGSIVTYLDYKFTVDDWWMEDRINQLETEAQIWKAKADQADREKLKSSQNQ